MSIISGQYKYKEDSVERKERFQDCTAQLIPSVHEKGMALIVVILVLAFLQVIGLVLLTVTGTGPKVAGNIRTQQQAYNAAEAGFDVTWTTIEESFADGSWVRFDGHYLTQPAGIDDPQSNLYFRRLTDLELLALIDPDGDGIPNMNTVLYFRETYATHPDGSPDTRFTYTAFLIDDEAVGGTPDPSDAILVCIGGVGTGASMITTRIEIELAIQLPGT